MLETQNRSVQIKNAMRIVTRRLFIFIFFSSFFCFCGAARGGVAAYLKRIFRTAAPTVSKTESEMFKTGCKLYTDKDYEAAMRQFQEFVKKFPKSGKKESACYINALCLGNTAESVLEWKKFIKKFHGGKLVPSAMYLLAQAYYHLGEYSNATDVFQSLLKKYPHHFLDREVKYGLGVSYMAGENWKDAREAFLELLMRYPVYYEGKESIKYFLGVINYHQQEYEQAIESFETVKSTEGLYFHGRSLQKLDKHISAMVKFKEMLMKYPHAALAEPARFLVAECFYESGDYLSAAEEYEKFLAGFPDSSFKGKATCRIACCHYKRKDYIEAVSYFETLLQKFPNSPLTPFAQYMIGESLLAQNHISEAAKAYTKVINKYPESAVSPQAYCKIGWCYNKENNHPAAVGILGQFLKKFPNHSMSPEALFISADSYKKTGKEDLAINCYQKILDIMGRDDIRAEAGLFGIIENYYGRKNYNQVVTNYNYILSNFPPSYSIWRGRTYLLVAEAQYNLGHFAEAKRIYSQVVKDYPRSDISLYALDGRACCYSQEKEFELARKEREMLMSDISIVSGAGEVGISTGAAKASNEFELGKIYYNQKKYPEALDSFEKFVKEYPSSPLVPEAIYYTGRTYYRLQYYTQAIKTWEELLGSHREHKLAPEAAMRIADTYFRAQKYPEAVTAYRRIVKDYPSSDEVKHSALRIAQSLYNARDDKGAIEEFGKFMVAYSKDPLAEDALEGIVMASYRLGEKKTAGDVDIVGIFRKFLEKFPQSPLAGDAQYHIAEQFYEKKEFVKAAQEFRKVFSSYSGGKDVAGAHFYMAESHYYAAKYDEAVPVYERFVENFPQHESMTLAYLHWANALFYLKDFVKAAEVYQELTRIKGINEEIATTALINTSLCYKKANKLQEASLINRKFIASYPKHEKANSIFLELAENLDTMKKYEEAIGVYSKLLGKLKADDELKVEIQYRIGEDWSKCGKIDKAVSEWNKLKTARPLGNSWRLAGLVKLAQEYEKTKKYGEAVLAYKEIIRGAGSELADIAKSRITALRQLQKEESPKK